MYLYTAIANRNRDLWTRFRESKRGSEKTLPNGTDKTHTRRPPLSPEKAEAILEGGMQEFWHTAMLQQVWIESPQQGIESNGLQPFSR